MLLTDLIFGIFLWLILASFLQKISAEKKKKKKERKDKLLADQKELINPRKKEKEKTYQSIIYFWPESTEQEMQSKLLQRKNIHYVHKA